MSDLKDKVKERLTITSQEVDRQQAKNSIFLTSKTIKDPLSARRYVSDVVKTDPDVDLKRVAIPGAVEIPTKNKDKTTYKVTLASKALISVPGKDRSRSLTETFMSLITKNNDLLNVDGDIFSVTRQVPKYLLPKKKGAGSNCL